MFTGPPQQHAVEGLWGGNSAELRTILGCASIGSLPRLRGRVIALRKFYSVTTLLFSFLSPCACELPLAPEASLPVAFSPPSPVGNGCPSRSGPRSRKLSSHPLAAAPPWLRRREVPLVPQRGWPRLGLAPARPRSLSPPPSIPLADAQYSLPLACAFVVCLVMCFVLALSSLRREGVRWLPHLAPSISMQETQSRQIEIVSRLHLIRRC